MRLTGTELLAFSYRSSNLRPATTGLGHEVARRLRASGRKEVVLIVITGYGQRDRLRGSAAGFDAHFTKPVDLTALDALLQRNRPSSPGA